MRPSPACALILLAMACAKPSAKMKAVPAPPLAEGWTVARDAEAGLSLAIPQGWRVGMPGMLRTPLSDVEGESTNRAVQAMMGDIQADMAKMEKIALLQLRDKGIFLHVVDGSRATPGEEPTRFFVEKMKNCPNLDVAVARERDVMPNEDKGAPFATPVGKAWRLQTKGRNRIGDEVRQITYLFADGDHAWRLHFVSTNATDIFEPIHETVAASFRKS